MSLLIAGMVLFIAVHAVPWSPSLRESLLSRLGPLPYKGLFALVSLGALAIIIAGKSGAPFVEVWRPPASLQHLTRLLVLLGFVLVAAAYIGSSIRRHTPHPMLWGVILWGVGHLLVNGDAASMVLFGGFTAYSLAAIVSANTRGAAAAGARVPLLRDVVSVAVGVAAYAALTWYHGSLFGYPLL